MSGIKKKVEITYYSNKNSLWDIAGDFCGNKNPTYIPHKKRHKKRFIDSKNNSDIEKLSKKKQKNNGEESDSATILMSDEGDNASEAEDTSSTQDDSKVKESTCWGCREDQPNQLAHMDPGGCLYMPSEDERKDDSEEDDTEILKSDKN